MNLKIYKCIEMYAEKYLCENIKYKEKRVYKKYIKSI